MTRRREQGEYLPRRSWEFETTDRPGQYILTQTDSFWTGDRWSVHIAEAMRFNSRREARQERDELHERFGVRIRIREAPQDVSFDAD